jgi:hypothetical protein
VCRMCGFHELRQALKEALSILDGAGCETTECPEDGYEEGSRCSVCIQTRVQRTLYKALEVQDGLES